LASRRLRWAGVAPPVVDLPEAVIPDGDEALVARAKEHPAAFAPLYRRYVGPIYGYCYQRLGTKELAEDATSQTFTKALAALPRYRSDSFRGWLYTIAHNVVTDLHRRRPTTPLDATWDVADHAPSPEAQTIAAESERNVRRLLGRLTPGQRDVIELELAGLTGPEIATVLGRRQGAIRATRFRAYSALRDLLNEGADA